MKPGVAGAPDIPAPLRETVLRIFGPDGEKWLAGFPRLWDACVKKWRLRGCRTSDVMSINYICFAESPDFGGVALKIGVPHSDLFTEMKALAAFEGRNMCRCYDSDAQLGAMLLERISPGRDLTTVASGSERTRIAARLIADLPVPVAGLCGFPLVSEWMERAFARVRRERIAGDRMLWLVDEAEALFPLLRLAGGPDVLLHGDLNHWNILEDGRSGGWKAIDPKGAAGPGCWEAGRYIINELEMVPAGEHAARLDEMTRVISRKTGGQAHVIALCAFLDKVLSTCWSFEEHVRDDRTALVDGCEFLLEGYRRIRRQG